MVPWWPVPNASAASISMPSLLGGIRVAVMLAVDDEASGRHRNEVFEAGLDPVLGLDGVEGDACGDIGAGGIGDEFAHQRLIRRVGEMHGDVPASVRPLERGDRGLRPQRIPRSAHRRLAWRRARRRSQSWRGGWGRWKSLRTWMAWEGIGAAVLIEQIPGLFGLARFGRFPPSVHSPAGRCPALYPREIPAPSTADAAGFRQSIHRPFPPLPKALHIVPSAHVADAARALKSRSRQSYTRDLPRSQPAPHARQMEPHIKSPRLVTGHAENSEITGGIRMKKITAVLALMCALSAYVSYPSAAMSGGATPSLARSMQESRSLPSKLPTPFDLTI